MNARTVVFVMQTTNHHNREVQPTMKDLKLTPRGELVRDVGLGIIGVPIVYGLVIAMIAAGDAAASF